MGGRLRVEWVAGLLRNQQTGTSVESCVYFARLSSQKRSIVQKIVLTR